MSDGSQTRCSRYISASAIKLVEYYPLSCNLSSIHTCHLDTMRFPEPPLGSVESFPYHFIVPGFMAYYVTESLLKKACRRSLPSLYKLLETNNQFVPFFGFCMGWLVTLCSTPVCVYAFLDQKQRENSRPFATSLFNFNCQISNVQSWLTSSIVHPNVSIEPWLMLPEDQLLSPISVSGRICIASRSILWVSELNRLEFSAYYIKHHLASLSHLSFHLWAGLPVDPIYLIYASLVTELLSTGLAILSICGWKPGRGIQIARMVSLVALRMPPIAYSLVQYLPLVTGWRWIGLVVAAALYWLSLVHLVYTMYTKSDTGSALKIVQKLSPNARFHVCVTAAFLATTLSTCHIYREAGGTQDNTSIVSLLVQAALAGFVGAQTPAFVTGCKHRQYWYQAGVVAAAATVLLSPISGMDTSERLKLLQAGVVSLLLGEALGRVGCHISGCCGSNVQASHQSVHTKPSLPLLVSYACASAYAAVLCARCFGALDLALSSALAVVSQGIVRILAEGRRSDIPWIRSRFCGRRFTATSVVAAVQVCVGMCAFLDSS